MNLLKKYLKIRNNFNYFFQLYLEGCAFYFNKIDLNKNKLLSRFLPNFGLNLLKLSIFKSNFLLVGYFFICLYWIVPERLQALELIDDFQFHGFFTQGYFLTSDNRIFGESDSGGSLDFTEAGLNASWAFSADLRVAGQVLFRRAGSGHDYDVEADFGLLDYTILSNSDALLGVRLGRFKNPLGLYNDTRDVLFTRPTILLPQSIYLERTRDLSLSADGGLLYGEYRTDLGNVSFEFGAGIPRGNNLDTELAYFGSDYPGNTDSKLSYIGRLNYEHEGGKYRAAISSARVDVRYDPKLLPPEDLPSLKDIFIPVIFSAQYNGDKLSLTSEYAIRRIQENSLDKDYQVDSDVTGNSYYLQALYRFNEDWQAIVRYDVLYNNREDKDGKKYQALTGKPAFTQFAKDWTFGLRYYLNSSFLVAAEYHFVDGTAWLPRQDNPDTDDLRQRWRLFSLAASYRF